jgi:hypothetical protein
MSDHETNLTWPAVEGATGYKLFTTDPVETITIDQVRGIIEIHLDWSPVVNYVRVGRPDQIIGGAAVDITDQKALPEQIG